MAKDYGGVINELVSGEWVEPGTGKQYSIPPNNIVIKSDLDGGEAELINAQHPEGSIVVVADPYTYEVLGRRVVDVLKSEGRVVKAFVWQHPKCSEEGVKEVQENTKGYDNIIAVGSGTINDSVKYASFLDGRNYSVFATSPMNAYSTNTASVYFSGYKKSIACHGAKGIFYDLSVISNCPARLISASFADVICRTTAQVDWLMSHMLFDTKYSETPYTLLAYDENNMIVQADKLLKGDIDSLGMLTRVSAIMGLGTSFTETTHSGSMAEHMMSHYIDMFSGENHPGTSHGEQVGVTTVTMSRLQNQILNSNSPPIIHASTIPEKELYAHFDKGIAANMISETKKKALSEEMAEKLNYRLANEWPMFSGKLKEVMLPFDTLYNAMKKAGCQTSASELGVSDAFYADDILFSRHLRDRFTMLDIAADSHQLASFSSNYHKDINALNRSLNSKKP